MRGQYRETSSSLWEHQETPVVRDQSEPLSHSVLTES